MKQKISISVDEEKLQKLEKFLVSGIFRSKSHVIEYSLTKFLEDNADE